MMSNVSETCQWSTSSTGLSCQRIPERDDQAFCILHTAGYDKDFDNFTQALEETITTAEGNKDSRFIDLCGISFPNVVNFNGRKFSKPVLLNDARFHENAYLYEVIFEGFAHFNRCAFLSDVFFNSTTFNGIADFTKTEFCGQCHFAEATFLETCYFNGSTFEKAATFKRTEFKNEAFWSNINFFGGAYYIESTFRGRTGVSQSTFKAPVLFSDSCFFGPIHFFDNTVLSGFDFSFVQVHQTAIFHGKTFTSSTAESRSHFRSLSPESACRTRFEGVDLSQASFLRSDIRQISFTGCTWATRHRRKVIYDDVAGEDPSLVADLYRQLRLNYESNRQEAEAGDFYIGQMEMRRRDKSYSLFYRALLSIYLITGKYGESYLRPFCWYAFLLAPVYAIGYWLLSDLAFADGLFSALTAGFLFREVPEGIKGWEKLVVYFNMLTVIYLLGLTLLALRRHFRR